MVKNFMIVSEQPVCASCGKICFSKKTAGSVVNYYKKKSSVQPMPWRYYFCTEAGAYHLSSHAYFNKTSRSHPLRIKNSDPEYFVYRNHSDLNSKEE